MIMIKQRNKTLVQFQPIYVTKNATGKRLAIKMKTALTINSSKSDNRNIFFFTFLTLVTLGCFTGCELWGGVIRPPFF